MRPLVQIRGLVKSYRGRDHRAIHAVRGVDLEIDHGQIVGLVGESGCGKSTLGRCILCLDRPDEGQVLYDETDVLSLPRSRLRRLRREMQMIFQDPFLSLNPRMTVGSIVTEPVEIHRIASGRAALNRRAAALLEMVHLPAEARDRYPHELSGGQRQRVGIARALAAGPRFIVADEPVSALDVSIQAQILNLLVELRQQQDLTVLFISHDLRVVGHVCDRVVVMYLGELVEAGPARIVLDAARHPYTRALADAVPILEPNPRGRRLLLDGEAPSPSELPSGCAFHPRCPVFAERKNPECARVAPRLVAIGAAHEVACHEVEKSD